ncbi:DNA-directed DNA polymerase II small subunit [Candidatus Woesearchaeota archaeon]|nr:DNA-directed DNA polymerase II small subunit [Candidatus Woesearchaeota archaeon]
MDDYRKKAVAMLLERNILVTPEMLSRIQESGHGVFDSDSIDLIAKEASGANLAGSQQPQSATKEAQKQGYADIDIAFSYSALPKKRECQDFVAYFNSRFRQIERMLANRPDMQGLTTISRLKFVNDRESVAVIGMVADKQVTKNGNLMLTVEDQTGAVRVLASKSNHNAFIAAKECVLDEVIGVTGTSKGAVFASRILLPEIPARDVKKSPDEGYAIFLSDLHVGSEKFLYDEFARFLKWINGMVGSPEQREVAGKVKYVLIAGDVVDGVGIYPDQEKELEIKDIYGQYQHCAELLSRIPSDKKIIIAPGNHDSTRISEPQPAFYGEIASPLLKLPNLYPVSNPAFVNIGCSPGFPGIGVLLYHGYSFDYYVANVDSIRAKGGYDRADLIMKFLLQRRHLAPSHSSTLYLPDSTDNLVISTVPDIFATGHIHRASVSNYRNVTLISSSCWQGKTSFQERLGHNPQPARVPIVNLKTREAKILNFGGQS